MRSTVRLGRFSKDFLASFLVAVLTPPPAPAKADHTKVEPKVVGRLPPRLDVALRAAFLIALEQLRTHPLCRELFSELGADGEATLAATIYSAAEGTLEHRMCRRRSATAFTVVGSPATWLCAGNFTQLSRSQAALYLIHEALHYAGLPEWPLHPGALTSNEIQRLVQQSCGGSHPRSSKTSGPLARVAQGAIQVEEQGRPR